MVCLGLTFVALLDDCSYHTTINALVDSGFVFSRVDVNHWSTIMQGLVAGEGSSAITSVQSSDVQCCYEAIITAL